MDAAHHGRDELLRARQATCAMVRPALGNRGLPSHAQERLPHQRPSIGHRTRPAGLQAVCGAQLTVFDAATALERAMEDLDSPTPGVPSHTLLGLLEAARLDRGEQHPFNGVLIRSVLGL